jgi:hypothetical protein
VAAHLEAQGIRMSPLVGKWALPHGAKWPGAARLVQVKSIGNMAKEPPDGNFYLVADATPLGKGRTRVQVYRSGAVAIKEAVRNWANGNERGCPDPMRTFEL